MSGTEPTRIERRCGQRFTEFQVPVLLESQDGSSGTGFTLDLSSRGALLWTDFPLACGQVVQITLVMPAAITLGEDMNVRCRARVLRLEPYHERRKPAAAVRIEHYDFLQRAVAPLQQHPAGQPHASRI